MVREMTKYVLHYWIRLQSIRSITQACMIGGENGHASEVTGGSWCQQQELVNDTFKECGQHKAVSTKDKHTRTCQGSTNTVISTLPHTAASTLQETWQMVQTDMSLDIAGWTLTLLIESDLELLLKSHHDLDLLQRTRHSMLRHRQLYQQT